MRVKRRHVELISFMQEVVSFCCSVQLFTLFKLHSVLKEIFFR